MGVSVKDFEHVAKRITQIWSRAASGLVGRRYRTVAARSVPETVVAQLSQLYAPLPALERCGHTYPVLIVSSNVIPLDPGPDPVLVGPSEGWEDAARVEPGDLWIQDANYRRIRRRMGAPVEPWENYRMVKIEGSQIVAGRGRYDLMLDTCDALEWELKCRIGKLRGRTPKELLTHLPLRRELHSKVENPAIDGAGRSPGISVSVLTAYFHQGRWNLLVRRRSTKGVAVASGLLHVIPSFMLAPEHGHLADEFSVFHNIRREFAEELFAQRPPRDGEYLWFERSRAVQDLDRMLASGEAELSITGLVTPTFSLRPEVCALLLIRDASWYRRWATNAREPLQVNEEFAKIDDFESGAEATPGKRFVPNISFDLSASDEQLLRISGMTPDDCAAVGAASFWLGVDELRRRLSE